jgi:predicted porin
MKKTLLAVAIAAAIPALAQAQTSVTLSGNVKVGLNSYKLSNGAAGNGSGLVMGDGSSRFIIAGTEDLGGGLRATFQWDNRLRPDEGTGTIGSGNSFVGLAGGFGQLRLGRLDQHYVYGLDEHGARSTSLQHSAISILSYVNSTANAIANASRTANVVRWDSNNMGGFTAGLGYSTAPFGAEGAAGAGQKGAAIAANLGYAAGPLAAGLSFWDAKDEPKANGQKSTRVWGSYTFGGVNVGLTWDQSAVKAGLGTAAVTETKRNAFAIPVRANVGPGTLMFTYIQAQDTKVNGATAANTGAKMMSVGYDYPMSKRTSVGVSFANINNEAAGAYGMFTGNALSNIANPVAGQDTRSLYVGLRHAF